MQEYQVRVVDEQEALEDKAIALYNFLASKHFDALSEIDQELLKMQYYSMKVYSGILKQRIGRFN
jgi:hypothetical protein